jgi:predicted enzyme related to lactoylglutathione lyase
MGIRIQSTLLIVEDPRSAARFYEGIGLRTIRIVEEENSVLLDAGGSEIWLIGAEGIDRPVYPACILGVDDLEASRRLIEEQGGKILGNPKSDVLGSYYLFKDPDGNVLEIRQPPARYSAA